MDPVRAFDVRPAAEGTRQAGYVQFNIFPAGMKYLASPSATNDPQRLIRVLRYVAALPKGAELVEVNPIGENKWYPIDDPSAFADQLSNEYPAQS